MIAAQGEAPRFIELVVRQASRLDDLGLVRFGLLPCQLDREVYVVDNLIRGVNYRGRFRTNCENVRIQEELLQAQKNASGRKVARAAVGIREFV